MIILCAGCCYCRSTFIHFHVPEFITQHFSYFRCPNYTRTENIYLPLIAAIENSDSMPVLQSPPSTIPSILSPTSARTIVAFVALYLPEVLAEGAARGLLIFLSNSSNKGCAGILIINSSLLMVAALRGRIFFLLLAGNLRGPERATQLKFWV